MLILCIGRVDRCEFRETLPALEPWGRVVVAPSAPAALSRLAEESLIPDVIVIAQSYPGEFSENQIDKLRRLAPLAPQIALLGTWCEGEMRSGTPWPGGIRVYWHQWRPHADRELGRLVAGRPSIWSLPPTACEEERCLAIASRAENQGSGPIEIVTEHYDLFDCLAAASSQRGYEPRWRRKGDQRRNPAAAIFDSAAPVEVELPHVRRLASQGNLPLVVLADFPRSGDRDRFLGAGANALVSRPFYWQDLFWHFEQADAP